MTTKKLFLIAIFVLSGFFLLSKNQARALFVAPPPAAPAGIPVEVNYDNDFYLNEYLFKPIARTLISGISNSLQNQLLNKIGDTITDQAGGGKNPHFILDWRNLVLNSQGRGNDLFRSILADSDLCPYFGNQVKQIFGADLFGGVLGQSGGQTLTSAPGLPNFQYLTKCSLSSNVNVPAFQDNFLKGGWETWLELQKSENNPADILNRAIAEQQTQIALEQKTTEDQGVADQGSLPNRLDSAGPTSAAGCSTHGLLSRCVIQGKIVTPGSLFRDAAQKQLAQKLDSLNLNADGIDNIEQLANLLLDNLISKLSGQLDNFLSNTKF